MMALWRRVRALFTWPGDEPEEPEGNRPETLEWRRRRRDLARDARLADGGKGVRRRKDLFDPYPDRAHRPRIRLAVIGGPFLETVYTGGHSLEDYPFGAAPLELTNAVIRATNVVNAKLLQHERDKAERAAQRATQRAERRLEEAIAKETAEKAREAKHGR